MFLFLADFEDPEACLFLSCLVTCPWTHLSVDANSLGSLPMLKLILLAHFPSLSAGRLPPAVGSAPIPLLPACTAAPSRTDPWPPVPSVLT